MDVKWRKSSRSNTQGDNCVEVATLPEQVMVRDSKHKTGPVFTVTHEEWSRFIAGVDAIR